MKKNVLYNPGEQAIPAEVDAEFSFSSYQIKTQLLLEETPALAEIACDDCNQTTKQMFAAHGIALPNNVSAETIREEAMNLPREESILDSTFVSVITKVSILEAEDAETTTTINLNSALGKKLALHVRKLLGVPLCDGCRHKTPNHIGNLLEKK